MQMQTARVVELLEPYLGSANDQRLTANDLNNISTYIDLLQRWNARINLTAIRNEEEIVTRHFGESLFAARHLFPNRTYREGPTTNDQRRTTKAADIGSGAGFPGIPIKLWTPDLKITLIESNQKKATFLREATRALTLTNINIQTTRAETLPPAQFDLVTLRAVERFDQILPTAANLLTPGGRLALLIGSAQIPHAQALAPNLSWATPIPIPQSQSRVLLQGQNHPRQDSKE